MRIYNIELNEGKQLIISNGFFSLPRRHFLASSRNLFHPTREGTPCVTNPKSDYGFYRVTEIQGYNVVILFQVVVLT